MFDDKLNNRNLYTDFGLIIQTGTAELLNFPERKESLSNDWREENGKEYDLSLPRFKDKEVTLTCAFMADNDELFWENYNAFFAELTQAQWQQLYIADHSRTYEVFYQKMENAKKGNKRLKNVEKVFVKFDLTLIVK
ncbi:hypothetical protein [Capnocytophaga canis]|uniref:hypothetical protein n=1 Tax=Capnocytophaga canis TaxID=1848903 RepID=UPI0015627BA5|nr:hypothetical protein [Capnocytophaga canis]